MALAWTTPALVRAASLAVLVAQLPHFVYHLAHAGLLPTTADRVLNSVLLGSGIAVPLLLLRGASRLDGPSRERPTAPTLQPFVRQQTILLTTYRRDGTPIGTPVHLVVDGDRAFFRTWDATWKFKRIRNNPEVTIAPSTARGTPTGPAVKARARILAGEEAAHASRALACKYPTLHGLLVPLAHRLCRYTTAHVEVVPIADGHAVPRTARGASLAWDDVAAGRFVLNRAGREAFPRRDGRSTVTDNLVAAGESCKERGIDGRRTSPLT
jgi:PPOX class probable F420-dependent enzyme